MNSYGQQHNYAIWQQECYNGHIHSHTRLQSIQRRVENRSNRKKINESKKMYRVRKIHSSWY